MSSAAAINNNTSVPAAPVPTKKGGKGSKTKSIGTNLAKKLAAAAALAGTATSGTPGGNRPVLITDQFQLLTKLDGSAVGAWALKVKNLQSSGAGNTALSMIADDLHKSIGQKFMVMNKNELLDPTDWKSWPCKEIINLLEMSYPVTGTRVESANQWLKDHVKFNEYRVHKVGTADRIQQSINEGLRLYPELETDPDANEGSTKKLHTLCKEQNPPLWEDLIEGGAATTVDNFATRVLQTAQVNYSCASRLKKYNYGYLGHIDTQQHAQKNKKRERSDNDSSGKSQQYNNAADSDNHHNKKKKKHTSEKGDNALCNKCGWHNHSTEKCRHKPEHNPDINPNASVKWKDSDQGKAWAKAGKDRYDHGFSRPLDRKFYGKHSYCTCHGTCHECKPPNTDNPTEPTFSNKNSSELLSAFTSKEDYTIPATAITIKDDLPLRFLLDIGALQGNYISKDLAIALESRGVIRNKCNHRVCSAMSNLCQTADGLMKFYLQYFNVYVNKYERIEITAKVLDIQFDLIIGLPTIKHHELITTKFAYLFSTGVVPIHPNIIKPVKSGKPDPEG